MFSRPGIPPPPSPEECKILPRTLTRSWFISGIIALCILPFGTTFYSEVEGQWYSSYVVDIAGGTLLDAGLMVTLDHFWNHLLSYLGDQLEPFYLCALIKPGFISYKSLDDLAVKISQILV